MHTKMVVHGMKKHAIYLKYLPKDILTVYWTLPW
jgi:hypothetical protein